MIHLMRSPTLKSAPIWLPIAFLLRDVAAWVYVFSYEPRITEKAVRVHHFLLMPGVLFGVEWSTVFNIIFGIVLGFGVREAALRHFPFVFPLLILTWNLVLTGVWEFLAEGGDTAGRLFRIGMLPGRYLAHLLVGWKILGNPLLLLAFALTINFSVAILTTAACEWIRRHGRAVNS
jgi:hypothetical protein